MEDAFSYPYVLLVLPNIKFNGISAELLKGKTIEISQQMHLTAAAFHEKSKNVYYDTVKDRRYFMSTVNVIASERNQTFDTYSVS